MFHAASSQLKSLGGTVKPSPWRQWWWWWWCLSWNRAFVSPTLRLCVWWSSSVSSAAAAALQWQRGVGAGGRLFFNAIREESIIWPEGLTGQCSWRAGCILGDFSAQFLHFCWCELCVNLSFFFTCDIEGGSLFTKPEDEPLALQTGRGSLSASPACIFPFGFCSCFSTFSLHPLLCVQEEAGLFKSRKDVCEGADPRPLLFVKPPAGMWICQDDRQPPAYLNYPPHPLSLSLSPTSACPLHPPHLSAHPLQAETLGFLL